jgi:capsular polysaccharide export protein
VSASGSVVIGDCDPWHMLSGAQALFAEEGDEVRTIASVLAVPTYVRDPSSGEYNLRQEDAEALLGAALSSGYMNPFTGEEMTAEAAVELCGFWRDLVDSNRDVSAAVGFAFWKRENVAPLLWNGSEPVRFVDTLKGVSGGPVALWRSKAPAEAVDDLQRRCTPVIEVEDGFLRSNGLGADCVPPLSITADRLGAYFDPGRPSELEQLLARGGFDPQLIERARRLRLTIIEAGLGKYEAGGARVERPAGERRHILVPGQVEDDRSVLSGGFGLVSNLDLLKRVRADSPDAYIVYKPHPDVVAGHRKGAIAERTCLEFADQVVIGTPISSLIGMVDEVHVNTSLAGFEALLRDKSVTTHGVPFYAGWGLTRDIGPVPARRTARRSVDELVAAALLLYPRYLDPVTRLPCPPEVVVERLTRGNTDQASIVVTARRLQGRVMRALREMVQ